jgi:hypothetical protein
MRWWRAEAVVIWIVFGMFVEGVREDIFVSLDSLVFLLFLKFECHRATNIRGINGDFCIFFQERRK